MLKRTLFEVLLALFFSLICELYSQSNHLYYHSKPINVEEGNPVEITQLMFTEDPIESGTLYFRYKGGLSYQEINMY